MTHESCVVSLIFFSLIVFVCIVHGNEFCDWNHLCFVRFAVENRLSSCTSKIRCYWKRSIVLVWFEKCQCKMSILRAFVSLSRLTINDKERCKTIANCSTIPHQTIVPLWSITSIIRSWIFSPTKIYFARFRCDLIYFPWCGCVYFELVRSRSKYLTSSGANKTWNDWHLIHSNPSRKLARSNNCYRFGFWSRFMDLTIDRQQTTVLGKLKITKFGWI